MDRKHDTCPKCRTEIPPKEPQKGAKLSKVAYLTAFGITALVAAAIYLLLPPKAEASIQWSRKGHPMNIEVRGPTKISNSFDYNYFVTNISNKPAIYKLELEDPNGGPNIQIMLSDPLGQPAIVPGASAEATVGTAAQELKPHLFKKIEGRWTSVPIEVADLPNLATVGQLTASRR